MARFHNTPTVTEADVAASGLPIRLATGNDGLPMTALDDEGRPQLVGTFLYQSSSQRSIDDRGDVHDCQRFVRLDQIATSKKGNPYLLGVCLTRLATGAVKSDGVTPDAICCCNEAGFHNELPENSRMIPTAFAGRKLSHTVKNANRTLK